MLARLFTLALAVALVVDLLYGWYLFGLFNLDAIGLCGRRHLLLSRMFVVVHYRIRLLLVAVFVGVLAHSSANPGPRQFESEQTVKILSVPHVTK